MNVRSRDFEFLPELIFISDQRSNNIFFDENSKKTIQFLRFKCHEAINQSRTDPWDPESRFSFINY